MHIRVRVESAYWALKRVLQNSVGDLCSVWDAMNNMITLQYVEIKASIETNTHVVGHVNCIDFLHLMSNLLNLG